MIKWQILISVVFSYKVIFILLLAKATLKLYFKVCSLWEIMWKVWLFSVKGYILTDSGTSVKNPWPTCKFTDMLLQDKQCYSVSNLSVSESQRILETKILDMRKLGPSGLFIMPKLSLLAHNRTGIRICFYGVLYCPWLGIDTIFVMKESKRKI